VEDFGLVTSLSGKASWIWGRLVVRRGAAANIESDFNGSCLSSCAVL
jgi:hypothetical protein